MHQDLVGAVYAVLRRWHTGKHDEQPWGEMLTVGQRMQESPSPDPGLAVREVVLDALRSMEEQAGGDRAQIVRLRFLDGHTAAATARLLNLTEDVVHKRQRSAISDLARTVWQAEEKARSAKEMRIATRLEIKDPPRLFGVADKLAQLGSALTTEEPPWAVALVGIGGIGKTSLADAAVRALASRRTFADVAWVSARQERFVLWDGLQPAQDGIPALTVEGLVDAVIEQFGLQDWRREPLVTRIGKVRGRLRQHRYLVVIDNLETAADYRALVPHLMGLVNPSRILLTSRHSLHDYPGILGLRLDELSSTDCLALMRHEGRERGISDVASAPDDALRRVYEVAGGNPLALKLLLGQMHALSLAQVVDDLRQARGRKVEELYRFIYWRSWQLLSPESQQVLAIMPLVAESGGGLPQIAALSDLAEEQLAAPLNQLVTLSLVTVVGTVEARRYGIHRLTEAFLLNEVLRWQSRS